MPSDERVYFTSLGFRVLNGRRFLEFSVKVVVSGLGSKISV